MKNLRHLAFILLVAAMHASAQQDTMIGNPPGYNNIQYFGMNGMAIDNSNSVWLGYSHIGLAKFDGTNWTVYDSLTSPLLKNNVLAVACNNAGVWAGTDTGLFNFTGATWNWYNTSNSGIPTNSIFNLYSKGGNELYIYSDNGFAYFDGNAWQEFNTGNSGLVNDSVQCLFKDAAAVLWIGTKNGLSRFDGNVWQNFTTGNSDLPDNEIVSLTENGNSRLFVSTRNYRALVHSGGSFYNFTDSVSSYYNFPLNITNLFSLSDGSVLLSSNIDYYIETDPVVLTSRVTGFFASDTLNISVIDPFDRVWRYRVHAGQPRLWMRDSLYQYPLSNITPPPSYNDLDINLVRCGMFNNNSMHWDAVGTAKYEVPKGSGKKPVFASALWIGGLDPSGNLHMAAQTYRQSGNDFWPGPLDTTNASIDSITMQQYDTIWKANLSVIDEFVYQFALGNVTNGTYTVPGVILSWPAHGTGNYSSNLAPFTDVNADGLYNPFDGDYPAIKGDQMLWWVMNDNYGTHGETGGVALGIEIRCSAYAYYCPNIADSNEAVNYTTFYSFDIINRSDTDYHDVYLGLFADMDLGNYLDDYVGCNLDYDIAFSYNGDNIDEGATGYGINPPMMNVAVLNGPVAEPNDTIDNNHNGVTDEPGEHCMMNHFHYYDNNNGPIAGNPNGAEEHYDYLQSVWRNGTPVTYGGNGYGGGIGATNIHANYFFPGMPYDSGWTETSAGNMPGDRRMVLSSGPFALRKGETRTADYAYIFSRDESAPNGLNTSVAKNISDVEKIKRWFDTDSFPCNNLTIGIKENNRSELDFIIYPNPVTNMLSVSRYSLIGTAGLEIFNVLGEKIGSYKIPAGKKEITLNTESFYPGIYFVVISEGKNVGAKKLVVSEY
jgi:hypothetical protein